MPYHRPAILSSICSQTFGRGKFNIVFKFSQRHVQVTKPLFHRISMTCSLQVVFKDTCVCFRRLLSLGPGAGAPPTSGASACTAKRGSRYRSMVSRGWMVMYREVSCHLHDTT